VIVGIGRCYATTPGFTARIPGVFQQPVRWWFDSMARTPLESKVLDLTRRHDGRGYGAGHRSASPP